MEVALQNAMFKYFSDTLTAIILDAKRSGRWDMGILGKSSFFILQLIHVIIQLFFHSLLFTIFFVLISILL